MKKICSSTSSKLYCAFFVIPPPPMSLTPFVSLHLKSYIVSKLNAGFKGYQVCRQAANYTLGAKVCYCFLWFMTWLFCCYTLFAISLLK